MNSAIYEHFLNYFSDPLAFPKFQMWSAHDLNIAATLNTLGYERVHRPAFASTIFFELRNKSGIPTINIWHKDDDLDVFEPITVSGCAFDCSLSDFRTSLSDYLVDSDTWSTECASNSTTFTKQDEALSHEEIAEVIQHIEQLIKCKKRNA